MKRSVDLTAQIYLAALSLLLAPSLQAIDLDEDGLDDGLEQELINRYRPYLVYDNQEGHWPCSATWFVQHSELWFQDILVYNNAQLQAQPLLVLQANLPGIPSTTTKRPFFTGDYRLHIFDDAHGGEGPANRFGMFARCTPLKAPLLCDSYPYPPDLDVGPGDILIQYFQLFAYNYYIWETSGNHEGDWLVLDVYVSGTGTNQLKYAVYHHHGDGKCYPTVVSASQMPLMDGVPVPWCFLEANDHEWWPYPKLADCIWARDHNGDGFNFRADTPINLGEPFHIMPGSGTEGQLVAFFNGRWGNDTGTFDSPSGPFVDRCYVPSGLPTVPLVVAYVDAQAAPWAGPGLGSQYYPFNTLAGGVTNVEATGHVRLAPGVYSVSSPLLISQPMTLECWTNKP